MSETNAAGTHDVPVQLDRGFMESCWRSIPDLHFDIIGPRCFADGASVLMVPWKMTGTHLAAFDPRGFAPTGRRIDVDGVDVYTFRRHKIAHYAAYYDNSAVARQLGLLPASGSRTETMYVAVQRLQARLGREAERLGGQRFHPLSAFPRARRH
ncbi:ester cyclase [Mycobacterium sp. B14F4]|uniref:ester cyclase n=1 Tax=Mycobacterium sp. B14F4 TaxID=3153565 RepID=UPI00325C7C7F